MSQQCHKILNRSSYNAQLSGPGRIYLEIFENFENFFVWAGVEGALSTALLSVNFSTSEFQFFYGWIVIYEAWQINFYITCKFENWLFGQILTQQYWKNHEKSCKSMISQNLWYSHPPYFLSICKKWCSHSLAQKIIKFRDGKISNFQITAVKIHDLSEFMIFAYAVFSVHM